MVAKEYRNKADISETTYSRVFTGTNSDANRERMGKVLWDTSEKWLFLEKIGNGQKVRGDKTSNTASGLEGFGKDPAEL